MREWQLFMHRADVDDLAAGFGLHAMLHKRLGHKKRAFEIYIQNRVVVLLSHIPKIRAALQAGVVHQDVDAREPPDRLADESLPVRNFADVTLNAAAWRPPF